MITFSIVYSRVELDDAKASKLIGELCKLFFLFLSFILLGHEMFIKPDVDIEVVLVEFLEFFFVDLDTFLGSQALRLNLAVL